MRPLLLLLLLLVLASLTCALTACANQAEPVASGEPTPAATPAPAEPAPEATPEELKSNRWGTEGYITLEGERYKVRWSDGDSFKFLEGPHEGSGVRLQGYNTLESYGPVHSWGRWSAEDLYAIAADGKNLAAEQNWSCTTDGSKDGYGRLLMDCPGVALHMIQAGHAHAFVFDGADRPKLVLAMRAAQKAKAGIWAHGVPTVLVTSLHSIDEGMNPAYNRVVDTNTGITVTREHTDTYTSCQKVCLDGPKGSCMTYVPFKNRYRNKPECLQ